MKKITVFLLLAALLTQLAACGNSDNVPTDTTDPAAVETEPSETRTPHTVPEGTTFDGASFRAGFFGSAAWPDQYFADELTGDNMNDSVYRREKKVEKELDVKISYNEDYDVTYEEYTNLFKASDDVYQLLFLHRISHVADLVTNGYLYDSTDLPYVDFSNPWYNGEQIEALRMGDQIHYIVSDLVITDPACIFFNRNMVEDNNLEDPYKLVNEGTWTLDKMIQMCIDVRNDVNGDGSYLSEDDVFGAELVESFAFLTGCDLMLTELNPDTNKHELIINNETTYDVLDKLYRLYENPGSVSTQPETLQPIAKYSDGSTLFQTFQTTYMENVVSIMGFDSGVIPFPKYDEEQENYRSLNCNGLMTISGCIKDPEMVGAVLELLSWESGNEVVDTYYNKLLKTRYSADLETRAMLELIFDTVTYDPCNNYFGFMDGFCGILYMPTDSILYGAQHHASAMRTQRSYCISTLAKFYDALDKLESAAETTETAE
ncbi:MAG: hypothetical protein IJ325_00015 [Clostridia bacterium]|nr:hypothetical protein [Clostridia bacterium]